MANSSLTGETQTNISFHELFLYQLLTSFSTVRILLSVTAFLGSSFILVAIHKESSLHSPSKLLYLCLATTELLVGLVALPLAATRRILIVRKHWSFWRYADDAAYVICVSLCILSRVFNDNGDHKRGKASDPIVGAEIQRDYNFEAHIYHCSHLLVFDSDRFFIPFFIKV